MLIINPHTRDLGGFKVQRLLPAFPTKMVGPFIFFDHFGPITFAPGQGVDVRPHPHIGLATVTYLFEGEMLHRDSLGSVQKIEPGAVNWMTAGRGIVHSERTPPELRARPHRVHGLQTWVALPKDRELTNPSFSHQPRGALPEIERPGVTLRLLAGTAFGERAPTPTFSPMFYLAVEIERGAAIDLPPEHAQRAVYAVEGELRVGAEILPQHHLAVLPPDQAVPIGSPAGGRAVMLGGESIDGDREIWWNFVASSRALIDAASERWLERRFPPIPEETEFIPLPERH